MYASEAYDFTPRRFCYKTLEPRRLSIYQRFFSRGFSCGFGG